MEWVSKQNWKGTEGAAVACYCSPGSCAAFDASYDAAAVAGAAEVGSYAALLLVLACH